MAMAMPVDRLATLINKCTVVSSCDTRSTAMQHLYLPSSASSTSNILDTLSSHFKSFDISFSFIRLGEPSKTCGRVSLDALSLSHQTPERGVTRLPDELLTDIFLLASKTLAETKTLSHVCSRFRQVVLSSKRIWRRFALRSTWNGEQILTVAERCGFEGIEARISGNGNRKETRGSWRSGFGSGSDELRSVETILSLHRGLETLQVTRANEACLEVTHNVLQLHGSTLPSLRKLVVLHSPPSPSPSPSPSLEGQKHFYDTCSFPHLEELRVDFCPRPALATNLVRCTLYLPRVFHLQSYLDFLSSAQRLQELHLWASAREELVLPSENDTLKPVVLPALETLEIHYTYLTPSDPLPSLLVSSIIPPRLRRLVLSTGYLSPEIKPLLGFLHSSQSPEAKEKQLTLELTHLGKDLDFGELLEVMGETRVERLEVKTRNELVFSNPPPPPPSRTGSTKPPSTSTSTSSSHPDANPNPNNNPNLNPRRILLTSEYTPLSETFLRHLQSYFFLKINSGHRSRVEIEFEFQECRGVEDGVYTLETLGDVVESMSMSMSMSHGHRRGPGRVRGC